MFNFFKKPQPAAPAPAQKEENRPQVEVVAVAAPQEQKPEEKKGWWQRLTSGLQKSSSQLGDGISAIFTKKKLDDATLEQLEEVLITADMGPATAHKLVETLRKSRFGKDVTDQEIRAALAEEITGLMAPYARQVDFSAAKPFVLLMVGVNGVGKTTTMGKLARQMTDAGKSVMMVAGDTFRAAAVGQLRVWAERSRSELVEGGDGADPASLAFKALERARAENIDIVMIDTAGRLHNKADLMAELQKIVRVIKKNDETAPHATWLVLDATTGQNAHAQVDIFASMAPVTGLVLTKLDGSARGGVLVALTEKAKLPIVAIGVGEAVEDLQPFHAGEFAKALCGVE